jgi:murein L,D-transpeptidase YafK
MTKKGKMTLRLSLYTLALPIALFTFGNFTIVKKKKKAKQPVSATPKKTARKRATPVNSNYKVTIDKSDYEMVVYDEEGWLASYPVVFGNKNQEDKKMEGDRLTPEGTFHIIEKRSPHKWGALLMLDYPTAESMAKFNRRKANGEIPANASPGGGIAIHGTWPGSEWVVDNYVNWTEGCISLRNADIEDVFNTLPVGTTVTIRP